MVVDDAPIPVTPTATAMDKKDLYEVSLSLFNFLSCLSANQS
jgi:hypothetical protein